ncbi:MAG: CPBP family intramembrane glutamic endopeptidase [Kibdelosporangium sp.]
MRRRALVAAAAVVGTGLLGSSFATTPGSARFYRTTFGLAATWIAGGLAAGPVPRGRQSVVTPVAIGAGAFGAFYACALVARHVPVLNRAITGVLRYEDQGSSPLVLLTTLANGAAEEVFFRGALYAAGGRSPVLFSTGVYALATTATRNPALVLASIAMGTLFGLQRQAAGGIQAPVLTHLTWSALMLRYLPPLFGPKPVR